MDYNIAMRSLTMRPLLALGCLGVLCQALAFANPQEPVVRAVQLKGVTVASPEQVGAPIYALIGTTPSPEQIQSALQAVEGWYRERGYALAKVADYSLDANGILTVEVIEGTIEEVIIEGNKRTRSEVLRRLVGVHQGEVYNEQRIARIRQRLGRFPFLRDARLSPQPTDELGKAKLVLQVEEERSSDLAIAAGYTSDEGFVGYIDFIETNVGGLAHRFRFQLQRELYRNSETGELEPQRPSVAVSYEVPRLLPGSINFGIEAYNRAHFYPLFYLESDILRRFERRVGFNAYIGLDWRELFELRLRYRSDRVDYDDAPLYLLSPLQKLANRGKFSTIGFQLLFDTREGHSFVHSGLFVNLLAERTLEGGDFSFTRFVAETEYVVPLGNRKTLHLRGMLGAGSNSLPISEQFWLGGYDLLRGYGQDEFYGTRAVAGSAEYRFPVMEAVQGAFFVDAGTVWTPSRGEQARVRWGTGVGLRFASPIGLLRLDVAYGKRGFIYLSLDTRSY